MEIHLIAPISGQVFPITSSSDEVFAQEIAGKGFFISPDIDQQCIYSPCDGIISFIHEAKHALMITNKDMTILLHVGLDTVLMKEDCFNYHVKVGQKISSGDLLMEVDFENIERNKYRKDVILTIAEPLNELIITSEKSYVKAKKNFIHITKEKTQNANT